MTVTIWGWHVALLLTALVLLLGWSVLRTRPAKETLFGMGGILGLLWLGYALGRWS